MASGRATVIVCKDIGRSLTRGVIVGADAEHITLGAAISANGHAYSPNFALPTAQARNRVLSDGRTETPDDFLSRGLLIFYRTPAGVELEIMLNWARSYLKETEELRRNGKTMVIFDGYASHLSLRVPNLLRDAGVIVYALPSHSSHSKQPLYVTVFGPMKERAKQIVSTYINNPLNDASKFTVYTACKVFCTAYNLAMTPSNIKAGFQKTGIYPLKPGVLADKTFGISAVQHSDPAAPFADPWVNVHTRFFKDGESLANSAPVARTGSLDTTAGAHVTNASVLAVFQQRHEEKRKKEEASATAALERVRKRIEQEDNRFMATIVAAERAGDRAVGDAERAMLAADRAEAREASAAAAAATATAKAAAVSERARLRAEQRRTRVGETPAYRDRRRLEQKRAARPLAVRRQITRDRSSSWL